MVFPSFIFAAAISLRLAILDILKLKENSLSIYFIISFSTSLAMLFKTTEQKKHKKPRRTPTKKTEAASA